MKSVAKFLLGTVFAMILATVINLSPSYAALDSNGYDPALENFFRWPLDAPYTTEKTANATYDEWNNQGTFGIPSAYQYRLNPVTGQYEFHDAIDIWAAEGTPVYAAADGVVRNVYTDGISPGDIFGNSMYIDHGNGYATRYCHLSEISPDIYAGASVKKGQQIGKIGHTGYSEGPGADSQNPEGNHLDFAIVKSDPYKLMFGLYTGTDTDNYVGQTNPLYYFGDDLKLFANKYYKNISNEYGDPLGDGTDLPKNKVWSFPEVQEDSGGSGSNGSNNNGGNSGGSNGGSGDNQDNQGSGQESASPSFEGDCRNGFLGLTSWDCGVIIKDEESLKTGLVMIASNVFSDIVIIAAYLVLGYVIYGGYLYIFSGGEVEKLITGKKTLRNAFIGLAIVMTASIIINTIRVVLIGANGMFGNCGLEKCVDPNDLITSIINWVIGVAGLISVVFVVEGGILYMTSSGDPSKLQKAKNIIIYALIGMAIVALALIITAFVSNIIRNAT